MDSYRTVNDVGACIEAEQGLAEMNVSLNEAGQERAAAPVNHIVESNVKDRARRRLDRHYAPTINRYAPLEDAIGVFERDDRRVFDEHGHKISSLQSARRFRIARQSINRIGLSFLQEGVEKIPVHESVVALRF